MNEHYVTTKEVEPLVSEEQKELILSLPIDENIENRFPFNDIERNKVEIYKIGSQDVCQRYINGIHQKIIDLFKVEKFDQ